MKIVVFLVFGLIYAGMVNAQVGSSISADGTAPNDNAMLDVQSPSTGGGKGMLIPRVSQAQRTTASSALAGGLLNDSGELRGGAAQGLIVYQTDGVQGLYFNTSATAVPSWEYYLPASGGTMSGALNMGGQIVTNVAHIDFNGTSVSVGRKAGGSSDGSALGYQANGNNEGAAVGSGADGYSEGAAVGFGANGRSAGAALGWSADGSDSGVAVGWFTVGINYGVAVGLSANGSVTGVAVGVSANGYDNGVAMGYTARGTNYGAVVGYQAKGSYYGAAVGYQANGYYTGAAVGCLANGASYGAAMGWQANGFDYGAAVSRMAKGTNYGAALGYQANGSVTGVAVGAEANGYEGGVAVGYKAYAYTERSAAVGWTANGYNDGAALGWTANGYNAAVAVGADANGSGYGVAVGASADGLTYGVSIGTYSKGTNSGVAVGYDANGSMRGVAVGRQANGYQTNIAIGYGAIASGGSKRIAIGVQTTNTVDDSAVIRGTLYLDGGTGVVYRSGFGTGAWTAKAFEIDHPLDPANKILRHFCLEGPQVWNVYAGNAQLVNGQAVVELPDYYSALNLVGSEIYSLTPISRDINANAVVKQKVIGDSFVIAGNVDMEVSWTIKVLRNDPGCQEDLRHRPVEQLKCDPDFTVSP